MPSRRTGSRTEPATWLRGANLLTQDGSRRVLAADLELRGSRIERIVPRSKQGRTKREPPRGARIVDLAGLTVVPGFVQAHVHLCQTLFRNQADDLELLDWLSKRIWVLEARHTPETLNTSALLGIHELLSGGTTCLLDMGTVRHTDAIYEAVRESGIRANVGKCLMDHPGTTPPSLREKTSRALDEAVELYEKWHGSEDGRIRASFAPRFVVSCTEELMTEVGILASGSDALIHTHASENLKEIQLVKRLVRRENIEYLHELGLTSKRLVLAHCIWLKPHEMEILARTGTHVVHCPSSNLKLASGLAHVPELRRRKINVALGADGAPCNNNLDMFREMRLAALIHKPSRGPKAMRAPEVLDMATRDGARALGWSSEIGSIEVGKQADLVALDLVRPENSVPAGRELDYQALASSIVYASDPRHVKLTMVAGRALYRDGRVLTIPTAPLMKRVHRAQLALRAGG
ncbi:MAG TPA: 5'-deoxyadenosine deaminase [Bdellovibrionota bacterium]|nr:5'-deoxyadenosine deaminase [Bdellovibrionota bacterium]